MFYFISVISLHEDIETPNLFVVNTFLSFSCNICYRIPWFVFHAKHMQHECARENVCNMILLSLFVKGIDGSCFDFSDKPS